MREDLSGLSIRVTTQPWILAFVSRYFTECERLLLVPDEEALVVMAQLAMRIETP